MRTVDALRVFPEGVIVLEVLTAAFSIRYRMLPIRHSMVIVRRGLVAVKRRRGLLE